VRGRWFLNGTAWNGEWVNVSDFGMEVENLPVEFDLTCELTGKFDSPIYSVFHTNNELELAGVELILDLEEIPNRRMESDTAGEWKPNYFIVVLPQDFDKANQILN
jgi:hypothetical protein